MAISSFTNYTAQSGVEVYRAGQQSAILSSSVIDYNTLSSADLLSNATIIANSGGTLSNVALTEGVITVNNGGVDISGVIAHRTVERIKAGGSAVNCTVGNTDVAYTKLETPTTATSTTVSEIVTNGNVNQVGYITSVTEVNSHMIYRGVEGDAGRGSAIVAHGGVASNTVVGDGARLMVKTQGSAINTIVSGAGVVDALGGKVQGLSANAAYISSLIDNPAETIVNVRVWSSATYGIPNEGYGEDHVWYVVNGNTSSAVSNCVVVSSGNAEGDDVRNLTAAKVIVGSELGSAVAGTYTLMVDKVITNNTYFLMGKQAEWINSTTFSSFNDYTVIKYAKHSDGYPYWDLYQVSSSIQGYTSTLKAFTPAYTDTSSSLTPDINEAKNPGVNVNVYHRGTGSNIIIPAYGNLNVMSGGIANHCTITDYGTLTLDKYAIAGITNTDDNRISLTSGANVTLTIPGTPKTMGPEDNPDLTGEVIMPQINLVRTTSGGSNTIQIVGNILVSTTLTDGDTIYTENGAAISSAILAGAAKLLINSGVSGANIVVSSGGILNINDGAIMVGVTINSGGRVVIAPYASGDYIASAGANIDVTLPEYYTGNILNVGGTLAISGTLGYDATTVANRTWLTDDSSVTHINLTPVDSETLSYSLSSGTVTVAGTMSKITAPTGNGQVYMPTVSSDAQQYGVLIGAETLQLVRFNSGLTSSSVVAHAEYTNNVGASAIYGTIYNDINISGITGKVIVNDNVKVNSPVINTNNRDMTVVINGNAIISGATVSGTNAKFVLSGFSGMYEHKPVLSQLVVSNGATVELGQYATVSTVALTSAAATGNIILKGNITDTLSANVTVGQNDRIQIISTTSAGTSGYGLLVKEDKALTFGRGFVGINMDIQGTVANTVNVEALSACVLSNLKLTHAEASAAAYATIAYPCGGAGATVTATGKATVYFNDDELIDVYSSGTLFATLSRGLVNEANMTSNIYHIYETMNPPIAGTNWHLSSAVIPNSAFWYCATDGSNYLLRRSGSIFNMFSCTSETSSAGNVSWTVLTSTANMISATGINTVANATPYVWYSANGVPNSTVTNAGWQFIPRNNGNVVSYVLASNATLYGALLGSNLGLNMTVLREAKDAEGNATTIKYHTVGAYSLNNSTTIPDYGMVVPVGGKVAVTSRTLVAPVVLSSGILYAYRDAIIQNVTQERFGNVNTTFGLGKFSVDGHAVRVSSAFDGKLDDVIELAGTNITGTDSTYALSMVDTQAAGDDRVWTNTFTTIRDDYVTSKILTVRAVSSAGRTRMTWEVVDSSVVKYADSVSAIKTAISSGTGSTVCAPLWSARWDSGLVDFVSSGTSTVMKINGKACGSTALTPSPMIALSYTSTGQLDTLEGLTPAQFNCLVNLSYSGVYSGLYVCSDMGYVVATSNTAVQLLKYDAKANKYVIIDTLDGILSGSAPDPATSTSLETAEHHAKDPWWISSIHSDYNTCGSAGAMMAPGTFIRRANTNEFAIQDLTDDTDKIPFRIIDGYTIENVTSTPVFATRYYNTYIGASGTVTCNSYNKTLLDNCVAYGGTITVNQDNIVVNTVFSGASAILSDGANGRAVIDKVALYENSVLRITPVWDIYGDAALGEKQVPYVMRNITNTVNDMSAYVQMVGSTPITMSGTQKLPSVIDISSQNLALAGIGDMFDEYITVHVRGCIKTPYLINQNYGFYGYGQMGQLENIDIKYNEFYKPTNASKPMDMDYTSNNNQYNTIVSTYYYGAPTYKMAVKNMIISAGDTLSIGRNFDGINMEIHTGANVRYTDTAAYTPQVWLIPRPTVARTDVNTNYVNTTPFIARTALVSSGQLAYFDTSSGAVIGTPSFSSRTNAAFTSAGNYYLYGNYTGDGTTITSATVLVEPGTVLGTMSTGVSMGLQGGLWVDSHGMALNVDCVANANGTVVTSTGTVISQHRTQLQHIEALNDGIILFKPHSNYDDITANSTIVSNTVSGNGTNHRERCAVSRGRGHVFYGLTSKPTTSATHAFCTVLTSNVLTTSKISGTNVTLGASANNTSRFCGIYDTVMLSVTLTAAASTCVFVGSGAVLSSGTLTINTNGTLIVDNGGKVSTNRTDLGYGASAVYMNGADVDLAHLTIAPAASVQIMSNFQLAKIQAKADRIPKDASGNIVWPTSMNTWYCGYDMCNNSTTAGTVNFVKTTSTTTVDGETYPIYSATGANQPYKMYYASGVVNPNTGSTFTGWVISGNYKPTPDVIISSAALYGCTEKNPKGQNWFNLHGRFNAPWCSTTAESAIHYPNSFKIYDCGHTDVTATYTGVAEGTYPTIIHVNGYVNGEVHGNPILGEVGIIKAGTTIADGSIGLCDQYIREDSIPTVTGGLIKFYGCTVLDGTAVGGQITFNCGSSAAADYFIVSTPTATYSCNAGSPAEHVTLKGYDITASGVNSVEHYVPFILRQCNLSAVSTGFNLVCGKPITTMVATNVTAKFLQTAAKVDIANGGVISACDKLYKARVQSGATLYVNKYARNVLVQSGGTLMVYAGNDIRVTFYTGGLTGQIHTFYAAFADNGGIPTYACFEDAGLLIKPVITDGYVVDWTLVSSGVSAAIGKGTDLQGLDEVFDSSLVKVETIGAGKPKIDNLKIEAGGTAFIGGFVTGFEADVDAWVYGVDGPGSAVDSRFIRTSSFFTSDYTW